MSPHGSPDVYYRVMLYVLRLIATVLLGLLAAVLLAVLFELAGYGLLPGWWHPARG